MTITKKRFQKLAGLLTEQMFPQQEEVGPWDDDTKGYLFKYVAYLRAIQLWFHGAHFVAKGIGFTGDHTDLYGKIYIEVQEETDKAIEKAIGITDDKELGCPVRTTENALAIMQEFQRPSGIPAVEIAEAGLELEKAYIEFLEHLFKILKSRGALSLGLNDQLAASANKHEEYIYLLSRRTEI